MQVVAIIRVVKGVFAVQVSVIVPVPVAKVSVVVDVSVMVNHGRLLLKLWSNSESW